MSSPTIAPISNDESICFRYLDNSEYYKLVFIFDEYNGEVPNPNLSTIAIAEIESTGEIIGFACAQLKPHAEPFWISPKFRGSKLWIKLAAMLNDIPVVKQLDTFIIADSEEVMKMCEALQLEKVNSPIYLKRKEV